MFRESAATRTVAFLHAAPEDYDISQPAPTRTYQSSDSETRRLETTRRRARENVQKLELELDEMELHLNIEKRWDPTLPEYMEALKYMQERKYQRALGNLQRVVVLRLFELHRLNLNGIGNAPQISILLSYSLTFS